MTVRTQVRRKPQRGSHDEQAARAVLQEAVSGHLAFVQDDQPYCIPMAHGLYVRTLYLHGSTASRAMKIAGSGLPLCYTVTLVDGIVVARAMFNSSLNYRSCVVLGAGRVVDDPDEVSLAYRAITDHLIPGRVGDVRVPTDKELRQTAFIALPLEEFSVKARAGGPVDDEDDLVLPHWAGVVPARLEFGPPQPADGAPASAPAYLDRYARPGGATA
jgi:nitroimidazol reductase NimA-like FMN-containing flavoprotein (pyridoxamine 5'-phosphate oxidase superfamily)